MVMERDEMNEFVIDKCRYKSFNLKDSLLCGQCFHFDILEDGYVVMDGDHILYAREFEDRIECQGDEIYWHNYFDLDRDYEEVKQAVIKAEPRLKTSVDARCGIRIFRQNFFECMISFIISQNNRIPRIQKAVFDISRKYGHVIGEYNGRIYYSFPSEEEFKIATLSELHDLKVGFRDRYILDAIINALEGTFVGIESMDYKIAYEKLLSVNGIGPKVASCIMLFSLSDTEAFPVDTWIRKIMISMYPEENFKNEKQIEAFGKARFGKYSGFAQQYMFCYARDIEK